MGLNSKERDALFDKARYARILKVIQGTINYKLVALTQQSLQNVSTARIPWLSKLLSKVDDTSESIINIGERVSDATDSFGHESISHGFHLGGLVVAVFDFVRIPLIYLAAFLLNEKIPFKLDNNARWIYSGFLLGLAITALFTPPVVVSIIAFVGAGTGLALGLFLLGRTIHQRYMLGRERRSLMREIGREQEEMELIQDEAKNLENLLADAKEEQQIIEILEEIAILQERYNSQKAVLEKLKNKQLHLEQEIKRVGMMRVIDKTIGVGLTSLTIIGLVVTLFFPPVGLWMLAGVAIAGGAYLLGRLATPLLLSLGSWVINKFKTDVNSDSSVGSDQLVDEPVLDEQQSAVKNTTLEGNKPLLAKEAVVDETDSTALVLVELMGKDAVIQYAAHSHEHSGDNDAAYGSFMHESDLYHHVIKRPKEKDDEGESESAIEHPGNP
jgi:hypothetical protein